jgi:UDP-N-acetylmuramoyl-L-alanyl-D-glutamate--2,6-diaminopimelate ligase
MEWWQVVPGGRVIGPIDAVSDLTHDSRLVRPGVAFVAVPGGRADGHDFIAQAIEGGVAAVVVQADHEAQWAHYAGSVPLLVVGDSRAAMGPLAGAVHDFPSRKLRIVGVTGTDGKTTTSHLIGHVLNRCSLRAGFLSSAGFELGRGLEHNESHMTTLEAPVVQSLLARAVAQGRETMVVEASSEGLAQHRLAGCEVDVAVFTNLTRDHLDFHGTMENYRTAKGLLFEMLALPAEKIYPRAAVLNLDDAAASYMRNRSSAPVIGYGLREGADLRATDVEVSEGGLRFRVESGSETIAAQVPLFGRFNVYNCLAAAGVAVSQGIALTDAVGALSDFPGVPGRLQAVDCGQPFRVYIDIASTPAALENTLTALRPATAGRLWAVFGAAGGRDPARRDGMGRVAGRLADRAVLTNEDPRDEDPETIIAAIAGGLIEAGRQEGRDYVRRPERREALAYAFENAQPGDTVLLAGKANETSMIFEKGRAEPWDETAVAEGLLRGLTGSPAG